MCRGHGSIYGMALTQKVKSELAAVATPHPNARRAEVATMLRFAGGLHLVGGRIVVEAEMDTSGAARRLRAFINELYSLDSEMLVINSSGLRRTTRYTVRVIRDGEALARLSGLVDQHRRPVRGLPPSVVRSSNFSMRFQRTGSPPKSNVNGELRHPAPQARGSLINRRFDPVSHSFSSPQPKTQDLPRFLATFSFTSSSKTAFRTSFSSRPPSDICMTSISASRRWRKRLSTTNFANLHE